MTCSDCALNVNFQVTRNASWKHSHRFSRMTNRPTIDDDFSSFSDFFFFNCSKSNEEADFRKAIQSYENTLGLNCRHTTHRTKRGTKGQTSQVIDMQLHEAVNYVVSDRTLIFRSFISGFAALDFTDFGRIPMFTMGRKFEFLNSPHPKN